MNQDSLVSIIVPVYNGEQYLETAIESILESTYRNIEVVIVDDGSEDGSREICRHYAILDKRVKLFSQKNKGIASARNTGLKRMKGYFFTFVDQDDYLCPRAIELLVNKCLHDKSDLVLCSEGTFFENKVYASTVIDERTCNDVDEITEHIIKPIIFNSGFKGISYIKGWHIHACLFKKSVIENYSVEFKCFVNYEDDLLFLTDYICLIDSISMIHEILYLWRMNFSSESYRHKYIENYFDGVIKLHEYSRHIAKQRGISEDEIGQSLADGIGTHLLQYINNETYNTRENKSEIVSHIREQMEKNNVHSMIVASSPRLTWREKIIFTLIRYKMYGLTLTIGKIINLAVHSKLNRKRIIGKRFNISLNDIIHT